MYLEGQVNTQNGPKNTIWAHNGMNLEYPEWDLVSYSEYEKEMRNALTPKDESK